MNGDSNGNKVDVRGEGNDLPFMGTLKPQTNRTLCSNTMTGTLAVDGWAVTFGTASRGLGGAAARAAPSLLHQM